MEIVEVVGNAVPFELEQLGRLGIRMLVLMNAPKSRQVWCSTGQVVPFCPDAFKT